MRSNRASSWRSSSPEPSGNRTSASFSPSFATTPSASSASLGRITPNEFPTRRSRSSITGSAMLPPRYNLSAEGQPDTETRARTVRCDRRLGARRSSHSRSVWGAISATPRGPPRPAVRSRGAGVFWGRGGASGRASGGLGRWCRAASGLHESTVTGSPEPERGRSDGHQGRCSPRAGQRAVRWLTVGEHRRRRGKGSRARGAIVPAARARHLPSIGRRPRDAESARGTDLSSFRDRSEVESVGMFRPTRRPPARSRLRALSVSAYPFDPCPRVASIDRSATESATPSTASLCRRNPPTHADYTQRSPHGIIDLEIQLVC